jgi:hypothetical protein
VKTTIKLTTSNSITVEPCKAGGVLATLKFHIFGVPQAETILLTPDQAAVLAAGLEHALEGQT